ncbi:MAG: serine/threonine-protein phosphatase [Lachnospiraceae bacterium]|nr:serine/threonine-protein phosphatase [Lachnospiraceae bacterium]
MTDKTDMLSEAGQEAIIEALKQENEHLKRQIAMAVNLRFHLMPNVYPAFPDAEGMDIYADQIGLAGVGGDFFDFFRIDADHIGIVIADIFDGGDAAALYMVAFKLYLMGELNMGFSPSEIIGVVNNRLARANEDNLCLTAWYGVYEISTGKITAVNAGHEAPVIYRKDGSVEQLDGNLSYLLAVMEGMHFESYEFTLEPGESLILYTDGVVGAKNENGVFFDIETIKNTLSEYHDKNARDIVGQLQESLFLHIKDEPLRDDASFLCLKRKESLH